MRNLEAITRFMRCHEPPTVLLWANQNYPWILSWEPKLCTCSQTNTIPGISGSVLVVFRGQCTHFLGRRFSMNDVRGNQRCCLLALIQMIFHFGFISKTSSPDMVPLDPSGRMFSIGRGIKSFDPPLFTDIVVRVGLQRPPILMQLYSTAQPTRGGECVSLDHSDPHLMDVNDSHPFLVPPSVGFSPAA